MVRLVEHSSTDWRELGTRSRLFVATRRTEGIHAIAVGNPASEDDEIWRKGRANTLDSAHPHTPKRTLRPTKSALSPHRLVSITRISTQAGNTRVNVVFSLIRLLGASRLSKYLLSTFGQATLSRWLKSVVEPSSSSGFCPFISLLLWPTPQPTPQMHTWMTDSFALHSFTHLEAEAEFHSDVPHLLPPVGQTHRRGIRQGAQWYDSQEISISGEMLRV